MFVMMLAPLGQASMVLDRSIVTFVPGKAPREDVTVNNPDAEPLFVEVEVLEVRNPGTDKEERIAVRNPEEIGLIATPKRLVVPAGSRRVVRLVNLAGHGQAERVYRVNVKPVIAPEEADSAKAREKSMEVKILVAYQLLVFVSPEAPAAQLDGRREGTTLHLQNKGNVNIHLYDGRQCPPGDAKDQCVTLQSVRLYPGNERNIALPRDQAVSFIVEAGDSRNKVLFD